MTGPLSKVTVLDLTWALAGPYATMLLADLGAKVIKIEPPTGDHARFNGPWVGKTSTYFYSINRGKKSMVIDLATAEGKEVFLKLVEKVDVVAQNFTPGAMERLGLTYDVLKQRNPRVIYAALSGFGQTGPYRGKPALDVIVQAMGGIMSITGAEGGEPVRVGASVGDIGAGLFFALGILAALEERRQSGVGQMLDVSMLDCQAALMENAFIRYFATGEVPQRIGTRHPVSAIHQTFPTKDGYIAIVTTSSIEAWAAFLEIIGRLDILPIEKYHDKFSRCQHIHELEPVISEALRTRTTEEWVEKFEAVGIACGPLNTIAQAAQDPQLIHRKMFIDLPCADAPNGTLKVSNNPVKLSRTPTEPTQGAPQLGEHTSEVLSMLLRLSPAEIEALRAHGITVTREQAP